MGLKISELGAVTSLADADLLPVVQGGTTKKATIAHVIAQAAATAVTWTQKQTVIAAPGTTDYALGVKPTYTATTSGNFVAVSAYAASNPTTSSSASIVGVYGRAETQSGNAQSHASLFGFRTANVHAGSAALTTSYGMRIDTATNTGGGSIGTVYGLYIDDQTAGATNWGIRQVGSTTPNRLDGKVGIAMTPVNTLDVTGTVGATGAATLGSTLGVTGLATLTGGAVVGTAPVTSGSRIVGARTVTATAAFGGIVESAGSPTSTASNAWSGVLGRAEIVSGCAFGTNATLGLRGVRGVAENAGSGTVTGASSLHADTILNSGGGVITNAYGLYLADQTAATNNYGVYQLGSATKNHFAGRVGIGVTEPDASAMLDVRGTGTQLAFGQSVKLGYQGAVTSTGSFFTYRALYDGTNWVAKSTAASVMTLTTSGFNWYCNSGLTDGSTFTPSQMMDLSTTSAGSTLWVAANPNMLSSVSYAIGAMPTFTAINNTRISGNFQTNANPTADSTGVYVGVVGYGATDATNGFAFLSSVAGVRGGYFRINHRGTGAVTGSAGILVESPVNNGGGTIATNYGVYIASQTGTSIAAGFGVYQAGSTTLNYFAGKVGIGTTPGGTYSLEVSGDTNFNGVMNAGSLDAPKLDVFAIPSVISGASYGIGAKRTVSSTSGGATRAGIYFHQIGAPTSNNTMLYPAFLGVSESTTAFNYTATVSLMGAYAKTIHSGSGAVTGAAGMFVSPATNTGGGSIANVYGVYLSAQTVGTSNYGVYQAGAEPNLFSGPIIHGAVAGPRDFSGTGSPEGIHAAPQGSTFRRTDGGVGSTFYVKNAGGTGNTGWAAIA